MGWIRTRSDAKKAERLDTRFRGSLPAVRQAAPGSGDTAGHCQSGRLVALGNRYFRSREDRYLATLLRGISRYLDMLE